MILRKCYGGAYLAMCGKDLGADRVFAWPTAEVAVMGAEGAAEIVFRKEIAEAEDKAAKRKELIERYREVFSNPYVAAGRRLVDAVIEPAADPPSRGPGAGISAHQTRTASAQEARTDAAVERRIRMVETIPEELVSTLEELRKQVASLSARVADWNGRRGCPGAAAPCCRCSAAAGGESAESITEEELTRDLRGAGSVPRSSRSHSADPVDQLSCMGLGRPRHRFKPLTGCTVRRRREAKHYDR